MSVLQKFGGVWEKNWPELHAALTGGLPGFIFSNRPAGLDSGVPVFCYHLVEAAAFEEDLLFLKHNGYVTIHADALLDHLLRRKPAPARSVVLTFDDGAQNLYETVFPLLKRYDVQAVAFIAPGLHEGGLDQPGNAAHPAGIPRCTAGPRAGCAGLGSGHRGEQRTATPEK